VTTNMRESMRRRLGLSKAGDPQDASTSAQTVSGSSSAR
jgi:hypothetical protein